MFLNKICVATVAVLLSIHAANTYILLTANLDDVHALAKQIAASPVGNQLNKIIRRVSTVFNQQYNQRFRKDAKNHDSRHQPQMRSDPALDEPSYLDKETFYRYSDTDTPREKDVPVLNDDDNVEVWEPNAKAIAQELNAKLPASSSDYSGEYDGQRSNRVERRQQNGPDLIALGKNASFYLKSIKKIFENV